MTLDIKKISSYLRSFTAIIAVFALCSLCQPDLAMARATGNTTEKILVLGDSLSAAFGIEQSRGWVSLLEQKLSKQHYPFQVINASISGETTQGGLQRLPVLLKKHHPGLVILELGANDGLRGLDLTMMQQNLQSMISQIKRTNARVLLIGMMLPPNYGPQYTRRFHHIYSDLSKNNQVPLIPFLLEGVATRNDLMQADGLHPTAAAQPLVLKNVWNKLQSMLKHQ